MASRLARAIALKYRFPKVRRCIQRAFLAWYAENQNTLQLPLQYIDRKDGYLRFTLPGLHPAIGFSLSWELFVYVAWQGKCWDLLTSFESWSRHSAGGYYYDLCKPEFRQQFSLWTIC